MEVPLKVFFSILLPDELDLATFGLWAFGNDAFEIQDGLSFLKAWNLYHGYVMELLPDSLVMDDAPKMVKLWRDSLA